MYVHVGSLAGAQSLHELVPALAPARSEQGYGTTASLETIAAFFPYLCQVFPGDWTYAICAVVWQNGTIPPHHDGNAQAAGSQRYHLVVDTNPDSWVLHDGTWQQLEQDGIYTMDPMQVHAAVNWGERPRIHFVVDVRRT